MTEPAEPPPPPAVKKYAAVDYVFRFVTGRRRLIAL
jgi:hypothetical protein